MRTLLCILAVVLSLTSREQVSKDFINPPELIAPNGYTHVVVTGPGKTVYISGEVPFTVKGELVGKDDFRAQVQQVYENLKMALQGCGATFKDVVKMNSFIVNYNPEYLKILREVRVSYLDPQHPPANTTAGVQALSPGVLIEVEAIAVIR